MHKLSASNKKRIINDVVIGARLYQKYLATKDFLIIADDGTYVEVRFHNSDFAHLVGIRSYLNDLSFYKNCVSGTIAENNIKDQQHYDFGTLRKKITLIKKIHKIIYTNSNVLLINLHTNTIDFPLAIENSEEKSLLLL
ncbi:MAG: PBECR4 domain-containing protein [Erysipelotrichaceae bacterium]|nr:PBECR4 domain-containing protein [Erysipelotrichaceae bacterium]